MPELVAIRVPAARVPDELRRAWDAGRAVIVLPHHDDRTAARHLEQVQPNTLVDDDGASVLHRRRHPLPDATALVVATSGSTGRPKAVVLTHDALEASTSASVRRLGARPGDVFTLVLPVHHVAGLQVVLRSWACGTAPEIVSDLGGARGDHVSLVPTQLSRLLASGGELTRWKTVLLGGGPLGDVDRRARAAGVNVVTSYGMTETCGGCVYDGHPLDGVEVDVVDGRIRIRGPVLSAGYLVDGALERAVDDDGWFVTGDRGRVDGGVLEVHGRADDVIVTGGENVPASEVADTLRSHPAVTAAAVVGGPDEQWGSAVVAVVELRRHCETDELLAHVRARLPRAWVPKRVVVVDELPTDGLGKPDRQRLEELVAGYRPA